MRVVTHISLTKPSKIKWPPTGESYDANKTGKNLNSTQTLVVKKHSQPKRNSSKKRFTWQYKILHEHLWTKEWQNEESDFLLWRRPCLTHSPINDSTLWFQTKKIDRAPLGGAFTFQRRPGIFEKSRIRMGNFLRNYGFRPNVLGEQWILEKQRPTFNRLDKIWFQQCLWNFIS